MKCTAIKNLFSSYMEGDVSETERRRVSDHLDTCERCSLELEALKKTVTLLKWMPKPEADPVFTESVMARVRAEATRPSWRERVSAWWGDLSAWRPFEGFELTAPVAASMAVLGMALGVFVTLQAVDTSVSVAEGDAAVPGSMHSVAGRSAERGLAQVPATQATESGQTRPMTVGELVHRRTPNQVSSSQPLNVTNVGLDGRLEGPAAVGRIQYVLPRLRPMPTVDRNARQMPANVHVENGYVTF